MITIIVLSIILFVVAWCLTLYFAEKHLNAKWHKALVMLLFFPALPFIWLYAKYDNHRTINALKVKTK